MRTALRSLTRAAGALGVAGVSLGLAAAPAGGASADARPQPQEQTYLSLWTVPQAERPTFVNLTCDPAAGTHPDPSAACRDIAAAGGDFAALPGDPDIQACPDVYDPVTAIAVGRWRGEPVRFRATYGNACEMRAATGPVFQLGG